METREAGPADAGDWTKANRDRVIAILCGLAHDIHKRNYKWWHQQDGTPLNRNKGEMLALIHSEISEALEGARKDKLDDHLPHRLSEEVELADATIRILDYVVGHKLLGYFMAIIEKLEYNDQRADHKWETRSAEGGKKF